MNSTTMQSTSNEKDNQLPSPSPTAQQNSTAPVIHNETRPAAAPDGGWRAWLQVLGSFIIFSIIWFAQLEPCLSILLHLTFSP